MDYTLKTFWNYLLVFIVVIVTILNSIVGVVDARIAEIRLNYASVSYSSANFTGQINDGSNDAYQTETGTMYVGQYGCRLTSSTAPSGRRHPAYRWALDPSIPLGANITACYIETYSTTSSYDDSNGFWHFQSSGSGANFTSAANNITGRSITTENVSDIRDSVGVGWLQSPSLVVPLQEVADSFEISVIVAIEKANTNVVKLLYSDMYENVQANSAKLFVSWTTGEAPEAPTVTQSAVTLIDTNTAQYNGSISDNGSANVTHIFFEWGLATGSYTDNETADWNPSFPDIYSPPDSGKWFDEGRAYYVRAGATNGDSLTGYSSEESFITLPLGDAFNTSVASYNSTWIYLDWLLNDGQTHTSVRYSTVAYPADNVSGTAGYFDTGSACNLTGLDAGTTYFIRLFSVATDDNIWTFNYYDYGSITETTFPSALLPPTNLTLTDLGGIATRASWVKNAAATYTMLRLSRSDYPSTILEGELIYYDTSNTTDIIGLDLDFITTNYVSAWSFESDNTTHSTNYTIAFIGGDMLLSHLFALIPLLVLLIISLVFYGKGLVHLCTGGYSLALGYTAVINQWEMLFFPVIAITVLIAIILFGFAMLKGDWL